MTDEKTSPAIASLAGYVQSTNDYTKAIMGLRAFLHAQDAPNAAWSHLNTLEGLLACAKSLAGSTLTQARDRKK